MGGGGGGRRWASTRGCRLLEAPEGASGDLQWQSKVAERAQHSTAQHSAVAARSGRHWDWTEEDETGQDKDSVVRRSTRATNSATAGEHQERRIVGERAVRGCVVRGAVRESRAEQCSAMQRRAVQVVSATSRSQCSRCRCQRQRQCQP